MFSALLNYESQLFRQISKLSHPEAKVNYIACTMLSRSAGSSLLSCDFCLLSFTMHLAPCTLCLAPFSLHFNYCRYLLTMSLRENGANMNLFITFPVVSHEIFAPFFLFAIILRTR